MYCKLHAGATFLVCKFTVLYWIDNICQHSSRSYRQITNLINRNAISVSGITSEGVTDFPAWGLPTLGSLHVYGLPVYKKTELKFCKYESGSEGVHVSLNRPCSSCLLPLFENEPSCKTLHTKKSLICIKIKMVRKHILERMVARKKTRFGTVATENSEMANCNRFVCQRHALRKVVKQAAIAVR